MRRLTEYKSMKNWYLLFEVLWFFVGVLYVFYNKDVTLPIIMTVLYSRWYYVESKDENN